MRVRVAVREYRVSGIGADAVVVVVEQLPLEIHRNFALLRELDDQTQRTSLPSIHASRASYPNHASIPIPLPLGQTGQLLELIRKYVARRLPSPVPAALDRALPVAGTYAPAATSNGGFPSAERHSVGVESARLPPPPPPVAAATSNGIPPHGTFQGYHNHHHHQPQSYAGMSNQGTPFQPPATIPGARDPSTAYQPAGMPLARDPSTAYQPPGMPPQRDVSYQPPTRDPTHDPAMHAPPPPPHGSYPLPPITTPATPYTATPQPYAPNPSFQHLPPPPPLSSSSSTFAPGPSTSAERLTGLRARHEDMYAHHLVPAMASRQLLPEIGKLARDMLRSADEKVGIAIGTYNTVRSCSLAVVLVCLRG